MAKEFELTEAEEAYYDTHRSKFEDTLSEAICECIKAKEADPIDGMIRALQKKRQTKHTSPPEAPSKWTKVQDILKKARERDQEAREDDPADPSGLAREFEWSMDRWLQQLKVHEIIADILDGEAKKRTDPEGERETAPKEPKKESHGILYVRNLQALEQEVGAVVLEPVDKRHVTHNSIRLTAASRSSSALPVE